MEDVEGVTVPAPPVIDVKLSLLAEIQESIESGRNIYIVAVTHAPRQKSRNTGRNVKVWSGSLEEYCCAPLISATIRPPIPIAIQNPGLE